MLRKCLNIQRIAGFYNSIRGKQKELSGCTNYSIRKFCMEQKQEEKPTNPFAEKATAELKLQPDEQEDLDRKLKICQLEVSVLRQEGRKAPDPDLLRQDHWDYILALKSRSARLKYYLFLWGLEKKKENDVIRKEKRKAINEERRLQLVKENAENDHIIYSITHNSLFLRIYETTINLWNNNKLTRAMQFGQKLVLDCSYDEHMTQREAVNAAKQLMLCFAENRQHDQPFDLYYCNANFNAHTMKYLKKHIPTLLEPSFPLNVHEGSYLDLFPKERLVYLTPHCRQDLTEYNHDDVYIIGAMVDKINNEPLSLAKAKKLGLRMARLPLDQYLQWGSGSGKSLTLNQMTHILLDMKATGSWDNALRHVPRRKLVNDYSQERQQRNWDKRVEALSFDSLIPTAEKFSRRITSTNTEFRKKRSITIDSDLSPSRL